MPRCLILAAAGLTFALLALTPACAVADMVTVRPAPSEETPPAPIEGFGAATSGGRDQPVCAVTSLADRGPGTLRACLTRGHHVVFTVAGTIALSSALDVPSNTTVDGFSAPPPGITLRHRGLIIADASNIILRGFRIRDVGFVSPGDPAIERGTVTKEIDCVLVRGAVANVVLDHMSIAGCGDGAIDVVSGPKNITIQWSIVSAVKGVLLGSTSSAPRHDTERISVHHTMMVCHDRAVGCDRVPLVRASGHVVTVDLRRNIFEGWIRANGTKIEPPAWVNVVDNVYIPRRDSTFAQRRRSLAVHAHARVFSAGNTELGPAPRPDLNDHGNESRPMPAPAVTGRELGCVVRDAGAHPRDGVDERLVTYVAPVGRACQDRLSRRR